MIEDFLFLQEKKKLNEIETKFYDVFMNYISQKEEIRVYRDSGKLDYKIITDIKKCPLEDFDDFIIKIERSTLSMAVGLGSLCPGNKGCAIKGYIPDFFIFSQFADCFYSFIIEIDGHEWHEKTKEQVKADKEREREFLKFNFIPIRFSGSEVFHNTINCVKEVIEIIASFIEKDARRNWCKKLEEEGE